MGIIVKLTLHTSIIQILATVLPDFGRVKIHLSFYIVLLLI